MKSESSLRGSGLLAILAVWLASFAGCSSKPSGTENQAKTRNAAQAVQPESLDPSWVERIKRERWTGDLDGMKGRRVIRVLVTYNRTYYFYDNAEARGLNLRSV